MDIQETKKGLEETLKERQALHVQLLKQGQLLELEIIKIKAQLEILNKLDEDSN